MLIPRKWYKNFLIIIVLTIQTVVCSSQNSMSDIISLRRTTYREKLFITTDRDVYFTGEEIRMKVILQEEKSGQPETMSKVVYFDLLDSENNPLFQIKNQVSDSPAGVTVNIPDSASTGIYILRAYTSWILDFSEDIIFQKSITIINPNRKIFSRILPVTGLATLPEKEKVCDIKIETDKTQYGAREKIHTDVQITDESGKPVKSVISVSVTKSALITNNLKELRDNLIRNETNPADGSYRFRIPEPEGLIVNGILLENASAKPIVNEPVSLSVVGKTARCLFGRTNERGEFIFLLKDFKGTGEIVIQPVTENIGDIYVELEQPFYEKYLEPDPTVFDPDTASLKGIEGAAVSSQINRNYLSEIQGINQNVNAETFLDFYGEPSRRVLLSDYIELTDLREVVRELLPEVMVIRKDDNVQLKVTSKNPYESFNEQALVLLDGVPFHDIEKLMTISSRDIERIDIVKKKYYRYDLIFDGIVSFVTKKGNLSVFEADNSVFRQVFDGIQPLKEFYLPVYSTDSLKTSRLPDTRNTLYWNAGINPDANGRFSFEFYSSDESGEYIITVEGITNEGGHFIGRQKLLISGN